MAQALNYAKEYSRELANAYPYVLNFGALYSTENNGRYRWVNAKTIEIPRVSTTGRVNGSADTIGFAARNYDNSWEPKTLSHIRKWSTLIHPMDIDMTNMATSISNITKTFNEEQKFPEMDAYTISRLYQLWTTTDSSIGYTGKTAGADTASDKLSSANILAKFDALMLAMDEARVPVNGRILYVPNKVKAMLKEATGISRTFDVKTRSSAIDRTVSRLEEVEVVGVPESLMKTAYTFTEGWEPAEDAKTILMFLVHPSAVITPVSYEFATLDTPSGVTEGKYIYYEESYEDVFILAKKADALQFYISQ